MNYLGTVQRKLGSSKKKDVLYGAITSKQCRNHCLYRYAFGSMFAASEVTNVHPLRKHALVNDTASVDRITHIQVGPDLDDNKTHGVDRRRKTIVGRHYQLTGPQSILSPEQAELGICWLMQVGEHRKEEKNRAKNVIFYTAYMAVSGYRAKSVLSSRSG